MLGTSHDLHTSITRDSAALDTTVPRARGPSDCDEKWSNQLLRKYPTRFRQQLDTMYRSQHENNGQFFANVFLRELDEQLAELVPPSEANEEWLKRRSKRIARDCTKVALGVENTFRLKKLRRIAELEGVQIPKASEVGTAGRLSDEYWWRRKLRVKWRRSQEACAHRLGLVQKRRGAYVSDENLANFLIQKANNAEILSCMEAINELGQAFTLEDLAERSVSNPAIMRAELMVRMAGCEQVARHMNYQGLFFTLTCPSRMHCVSSRSGKVNPLWDQTTPKEAQQYLSNIWSRIRAKLKRMEIEFFGIRVAEPHHDGTPHWHLLVFVPSEHSKTITSIMTDYALKDSPEEKGASRHRITVVPIDWGKGSATGYVAKYISKNIDGFGVSEDEHGLQASKSAIRVKAWASIWGIRQFQFFGLPKITLWRELRRLNAENVVNSELVELVKNTQANNWFEFQLKIMEREKADFPEKITVMKIWNAKKGKYGEPIGFEIKGITFNGVSYPTRIHDWQIRAKKREEKELITGENSMVNEVKRPLSGAAWQGVRRFDHAVRGPRVNSFSSLEFYQ